jgi:undecaprenyl diphosphate synthase
VIGDLSRFSAKLQQKIIDAQALTAQNTALNLNICANYGGRWDIAQAASKAAQQCLDQGESLDTLDEQAISNHMCLSHLPPLDLLIRTGGDFRISNFLIWQAAYAELYFTEVLWPDFDETTFNHALDVFAGRERRFGFTGEQIKQQSQLTEVPIAPSVKPV